MSHLVELTEAEASRLSLLVHDPSAVDECAARTTIDALVAETGRPGELAIEMAGATFQARVFGHGRAWGARRRVTGVEPAVAGTEQVRAPMPGKIARVLVAPGERVRSRQPLVVVEAMKMENELRAGADAHVKDVLVTEGTLVEAGRVLVVLEG
ncbi:MAG: biotin/lipoyl-binding protein [Acidobacteria bacterium]|nr:biotin/lipoyl-binding protein [Acidobacteriota bacterium]MBI3263518.1 biotin/lipoyl-binding protein [Acidobacteriota bacterium]